MPEYHGSAPLARAHAVDRTADTEIRVEDAWVMNWQAASSIIAAVALLVSASVFVIQLRDRHQIRNASKREQAELVAGWVARNPKTQSASLHVRNGSNMPIYDVVFVVRTADDLDADLELIPLIPPDTVWSWPAPHLDDDAPRLRVLLTFRDTRGNAWRRGPQGHLTQARRPIDNQAEIDRSRPG